MKRRATRGNIPVILHGLMVFVCVQQWLICSIGRSQLMCPSSPPALHSDGNNNHCTEYFTNIFFHGVFDMTRFSSVPLLYHQVCQHLSLCIPKENFRIIIHSPPNVTYTTRLLIHENVQQINNSFLKEAIAINLALLHATKLNLNNIVPLQETLLKIPSNYGRIWTSQ